MSGQWTKIQSQSFTDVRVATYTMAYSGPFPTGEYLLVVIDAYSRFPEVEIVHSTSARGTIDN